jgi:hypothetical protein
MKTNKREINKNVMVIIACINIEYGDKKIILKMKGKVSCFCFEIKLVALDGK